VWRLGDRQYYNNDMQAIIHDDFRERLSARKSAGEKVGFQMIAANTTSLLLSIVPL
jgi:hypothetical protein